MEKCMLSSYLISLAENRKICRGNNVTAVINSTITEAVKQKKMSKGMKGKEKYGTGEGAEKARRKKQKNAGAQLTQMNTVNKEPTRTQTKVDNERMRLTKRSNNLLLC